MPPPAGTPARVPGRLLLFRALATARRRCNVLLGGGGVAATAEEEEEEEEEAALRDILLAELTQPSPSDELCRPGGAHTLFERNIVRVGWRSPAPALGMRAWVNQHPAPGAAARLARHPTADRHWLVTADGHAGGGGGGGGSERCASRPCTAQPTSMLH